MATNVLTRLDRYTNEPFSFVQTIYNAAGGPMTDADVDDVMYVKNNDGKYYVRQITGPVNVKWFGAKGDGVTDDQPAFQKACNFGLDVIVPATDSFYLFKSRVRLFGSIYGNGNPTIKMWDYVNTMTTAPAQVGAYQIFNVASKPPGNTWVIDGLTLDGSFDGAHQAPSEHEHLISIAKSSNVTVSNCHLLNPVGDCVYIGAVTFGYGSVGYNACRDITIVDNVMSNPLRCTVSLVSAIDTVIRGNNMSKSWNYVACVDVEPNGGQYDIWVHNAVIENNIIYCSSGVSVGIKIYGGSDYTTAPSGKPYLPIDYGTKSINVVNNLITASMRAIYLTPSVGTIKNILIDNNKYDSPLFIFCNAFAQYAADTVVITNNKPIDMTVVSSFGSLSRIVNGIINDNSCWGDPASLETILLSASSNLSLKRNILTNAVLGIRLANVVDNISIEENTVVATGAAIRVNPSSVITGLSLINNSLTSTTDYPLNVMAPIDRVNISSNKWIATTTNTFVNSPAQLVSSPKTQEYTGHLYTHGVTPPSTATNFDGFRTDYFSISSYDATPVINDRYVRVNGEWLGIGLYGEFIRNLSTDALPTVNVKTGHRLTNTSGVAGNTTYIREGGVFAPIQCIKSGTTAQRPAAVTIGYQYFDTTLGKPIYLKSTAPNVWVDATGTVA